MSLPLTLSNSLFDNLYKDFIGAQHLTERLNSFYDGTRAKDSFPPYNIVEHENGDYSVQLAVAGYNKSEITISNENNVLVVSGKKETKTESKAKWIWAGIAQRNFERRFLLEDNIKVTGAEMLDGILSIDLQKIVPEKPKTTLIQIK
jgi:molecular chaperone IbpA